MAYLICNILYQKLLVIVKMIVGGWVVYFFWDTVYMHNNKLNNDKHIHNCFMTLLDFVPDYPGSWHQKGKTNLDLLEQETVSGSGISWTICKSAP